MVDMNAEAKAGEMNRGEDMPRSIQQFQQLWLISLGLRFLRGILFENPSAAELITILVVSGAFVLLVQLAAIYRKGWARWLLLVSIALMSPLLLTVPQSLFSENPVGGILCGVGAGMQIIGLALTFTKEARAWFRPAAHS